MMSRRLSVFVVGLTLCAISSPAAAADLTCTSATTLEALATCIRNQMPASGSNGYVAPTAAEQTDWRAVIREMLDGSCSATLPASLTGIMQRRLLIPRTDDRTAC